ncbi:MAG: adenosylhomocysteinase [Solirubrobacteraceae bacterium]|nr:adenosylhomocysteinase [Solirubrobacteraceae bacterium]
MARGASRPSSAVGHDAIAWAERQMPVLRRVAGRLADGERLAQQRVGVCLHVTAETGALVRALARGGADVDLVPSNPLSVHAEVAAALADEPRITVHLGTPTPVGHERALAAVAQLGPSLVIDDGADLARVLHSAGTADAVIGGTEGTTTGVLRLRSLAEQRSLEYPVLAVNDTPIRHLFDNRLGTGQSVLDGLIRTTNLLLAGSRVAVFGYGACGRGIALRAHGLGATTIVCEVDPVRALEARMDGHDVMPGLDAAARADVVITATGAIDVLGANHFAALRDGAILANAGHFDVEIDTAALAQAASDRRTIRPLVEEFDLGGRSIVLLAGGRVINLAAADGHPAGVMDLLFAGQAVAAAWLAEHGSTLAHRVHPVPDAIDADLARLALEAQGVRIDELTGPQRSYLTSWAPVVHESHTPPASADR